TGRRGRHSAAKDPRNHTKEHEKGRPSSLAVFFRVLSCDFVDRISYTEGAHTSSEKTAQQGVMQMQSIRRIPRRQLAVIVLAVAPAVAFLTTWNQGRSAPQAGAKAPDGWTTAAVRDEIRPEFA